MSSVLRAAVPAALFALALAAPRPAAGGAAAGEEAPPAPSPPSGRPPDEAPPREETPPGGTPAPPTAGETPPPRAPGHIDASHLALERAIDVLVDRLDQFFGDERYLDFGRPDSTARWRNQVRLTDDGNLAYLPSLRLDLRLPALTRWLARAHIVATSEETGSPGGQAGDEFAPALGASQGTLELRFDLLRARGTMIYLGGGARFGLPPDPFVRTRLRQDLPLGLVTLARVTQSVFWELKDRLGEQTELELEQGVWRGGAVRSVAGARLTQRRGLEWAAGLELRSYLAERLAGAIGGSMRGAARSAAAVDEYRVFARVRRDVLRRWLFLEIEPEVTWPVDVAGARRRIYGLIFRLDVLFAAGGRPAVPGGRAEDGGVPGNEPPSGERP